MRQDFGRNGGSLPAGALFALLCLSLSSAAQRKAPALRFEADNDTVVFDGLASLKGRPYGRLQVRMEAVACDSLDAWDLRFLNTSRDTIALRNVLPWHADPQSVRLTGLGEHPLSRSHLFLPGRSPVNVILPDNAWETSFSYRPVPGRPDTATLCRRDTSTLRKARRRRFETILYPGGSVTYRLWSRPMEGGWQEGLRYFLQTRHLFDTPVFDDSLYRRNDLRWIRRSFVMHLLMAWDDRVYDAAKGRYTLPDFLRKGKALYGGDDAVGIWPTWPTLGLDRRNQFDLYRDLPGGLPALRRLSDSLHSLGSRLFIAYNPWDEDTRREGHLAGLEALLRTMNADGVVLDTRGSSSRELQQAADRVRPGIVMYSEGMAIPKDMPGIVAGRVHNALYHPPLLNLNKLIRPDFAVFRVAELYKEPVRREFATALFNGYGTELNVFAPGDPPWVQEQYRYLGRSSRILREHAETFTGGRLTPLIATSRDGIWVNRWEGRGKTLYTLFSLLPEGCRDTLFPVPADTGVHYVDIWNHREIQPVTRGRDLWLTVQTDAFDKSLLGSNEEGAAGCIAAFPLRLNVRRDGDRLHVAANGGTQIRVWAGQPAYDRQAYEWKIGDQWISLFQTFDGYEGDFVVQLFDAAGELIDERIESLPAGTPRRISHPIPAPSGALANDSMVRIPAGTFRFQTSHGDGFIPYPAEDEDSLFRMPSFLMDRFPVTHRQFKRFLDATGYKPSDTARFLLDWKDGDFPSGKAEHPVVHVSLEDAKAYAAWAGKRLPTEVEWQYAAQTREGLEWPWRQEQPVSRTEERITETLTVKTIQGIDPSRCNLGDGIPKPVGSYPSGANPFGLQDLVGSVWQLTQDEYRAGRYRYFILKGGSFFKPSSSWWYIQGGPRELHYRQHLLRVSQGFERNETVGFRCVRDLPSERPNGLR